VIEVELSLLEANREGGVEGEVLGEAWEGCGFKGRGSIFHMKTLRFCMFFLHGFLGGSFLRFFSGISVIWVSFG